MVRPVFWVHGIGGSIPFTPTVTVLVWNEGVL